MNNFGDCGVLNSWQALHAKRTSAVYMDITFPFDDSDNRLASVLGQCMEKKQRQEALRGLMSAILAEDPATAMPAPTFAPFPQANVRQSILPQEWEIYLHSWTSLADLYLRLNEKDFASALARNDSLANFLITFFHQLAEDDSLTRDVDGLRKKCFLLIHRIYSGDHVPIPLLYWPALSDICHAFPKSERFRALIQGLWKRKGGILEHTLQDAKATLIRQLDSKTPEDADAMLYSLAPLLRTSPDAGLYLLTGSDFLDSLGSAYPKVPVSIQKKLVSVAYIGLVSLLEGPKPNYSLLSDHLYSLKNTGEHEQIADPMTKTFLADLITNTPLLSKLHDGISSPEGQRVKNMAASMSMFRQSTFARPKKLIRRKVEKGKGKAINTEFDHGTFGEIHVHRMSLVSQIQDLFPDLGSAFVVKLLDEYNENIEEVTGHLLEGSLSPHLANADRSEQL
jgi:activating signal cointegrator complex subunit 2